MKYYFALLVVAIATSSGFSQIKVDTIYAVTKIQDEYPSWSPDGKRLTFQSNRNHPNHQVYTMSAEGLNLKQISSGQYTAETPIWSPDGQVIMYAGYLDPAYINNDLFLVDTDGSDLKQLTHHPLRDGHSKYSADGKLIIFNSQRDDDGSGQLENYELYEMNADGTNVKRLTDYQGWDTYPSYSPDNKRIIWRRLLYDSTAIPRYNSEIFIMNRDGSELKNLTQHQSYDAYPEWSPDGKRIVFASNRHGIANNHFQLFVMDADGSNVQQITWNQPGESDVRPDWSPDGKKIVFNRESSQGTRVLIMNVSHTEDISFFNEVTSTVITEARSASRGVAWGDYDGNGYPDLLVANTMNNSELLYSNLQGDFEQIVEGDQVTAAGWTEGVNWVDYNNDGHLDIFLSTQWGRPNELFKNDGSGSFLKTQAGDLTSDSTSSPTSCWCDYDLDGDLDVYVVQRDEAEDVLYNNDGSGKFSRVEAKKFPYKKGDGRVCIWGDTNGDTYPELFVGNFLDKSGEHPAKSTNHYYLNNGDGSFSEVTNSIITSAANLTYGASFVDFDQDNDLDLFITNIAKSDSNALYQNDGKGNFHKVTTTINDTAGRPSKGHTWGDFDNDGDLDLFIANGTEGIAKADLMNMLYLNNGQGDFVPVKVGVIVNTPNISAGTAWSDVDRDGDLDIFVANWGNSVEANAFYRNDLYDTHWLGVFLRGRESNSFGIGAKVRLKLLRNGEEVWLTRWLWPQTGYGSQNEPLIHFGLGKNPEIKELRVYWPSGKTNILKDIKPNQYLKVEEP